MKPPRAWYQRRSVTAISGRPSATPRRRRHARASAGGAGSSMKAGSGTTSIARFVQAARASRAKWSRTDRLVNEAQARRAAARLSAWRSGPAPIASAAMRALQALSSAMRAAQYGILARLSSSWNRPPPAITIRSLVEAVPSSARIPARPRGMTRATPGRDAWVAEWPTTDSSTVGSCRARQRVSAVRIARSPTLKSASPPNSRTREPSRGMVANPLPLDPKDAC